MYSQDTIRTGTRNAVISGKSGQPSISDLFKEQTVESLDIGAAAIWEKDRSTHVFEIVEGVMRVFKMMADGRRVITGFMYPGDLMGVSVGDQYLYTAEAVNKVKFRRLSRTKFEAQVAMSPDLPSLIFAHLRDEMAAAQDQMVLLACKTAEERVGTHILRMAHRHDGAATNGTSLEIPMTRGDMADYLGLTLETVSRIMSRLFSRGIIAQTGRHTIEIRKSATLAALAGDRDEADLRVHARTSLN